MLHDDSVSGVGLLTGAGTGTPRTSAAADTTRDAEENFMLGNRDFAMQHDEKRRESQGKRKHANEGQFILILPA